MFKKRFLEYKQEQERRRRFHQSAEEDFHLHRFPRPPFGPFNPVYPLPDPRFLGGEHDLNPEFQSGIPDLFNGRPGNTGLRGLPVVPPVPSPFVNRGRTGRGRGNLTGSPFFGQGPFM